MRGLVRYLYISISISIPRNKIHAFFLVNSGPADTKWVLLFRNDACSFYCAVTIFLLHAYKAGLFQMKKGPIYGKLDNKGKLLKAHCKGPLSSNPREMAGKDVEVWYTANGEMVNLTSKKVGEMATTWFDAVGLYDCGFHCQRVMVYSSISPRFNN